METTTIKFPINFNPIGLEYTMKHTTFDLSNNVAYLYDKCQKAVQDNIECVLNRASGKPQLKVDSILQITDGTRYRIHQAIASGSYGITAVVQNSTDGRYYCLKRQIADDDRAGLDAFKEAMMHHILDLYTRPYEAAKSTLIPTLYHVVQSMVGRQRVVYFIMDLMYDSLSNRLNKIPSDHGRLRELMDCLYHITPTLNMLYKRGIYNHGDLHTGNVMFDASDGSYKLIDYGFSRIQIGGKGGNVMELNRRNARSDASRDLTHLISTFEMYHRGNRMAYRGGSYEYEIEQLIKRVAYEGQCSGLEKDGLEQHDAHGHNFINLVGKMPYDYFTDHMNKNGTHLKIQQTINEMRRLVSLDASSSELMPYAASAASSSSAAPRTPRPARAANAAASAVVRQINQDNQGIMLLYLFITVIAFIFGSKIYYGKGGRDPMNSLEMYHLSIPSKHTTYESMSFPTHSIQMKSFNNSKTRTNSKIRFVSKKNTTRRSHKIPYAKIEDFDKLSLVSLYHFLRFEAFPGVSQKEKKEMLREAAMVPLQRSDVFAQIVEAVKEKDMDYMMDILKENKLDLSKLGMEIQPYQELWNSILDAYFAEKDSPFDLLQTLLHMGDQVEDFLERYDSANKEMKKMMIMQTCITASDCPELMLE